MSGAWDDEDFEPEGPTAPPATDKWEGEDEDDDVKDNWDDEEEEKKAEGNSELKATQVKKKKGLKERLAEKEAAKQKELEEKKKREAAAKKAETPEEKIAEKLRLQKLQEDSELEMVKTTFFGNDTTKSGLDAMNPTSKADFIEFHRVLKDKLLLYEKSPFYPSLLEGLLRDCAAGMDAEDIKKLASGLNTLANEKVKASKAKSKKKSQKVSLKKDSDPTADMGDYGYEYDDFI